MALICSSVALPLRPALVAAPASISLARSHWGTAHAAVAGEVGCALIARMNVLPLSRACDSIWIAIHIWWRMSEHRAAAKPNSFRPLIGTCHCTSHLTFAHRPRVSRFQLLSSDGDLLCLLLLCSSSTPSPLLPMIFVIFMARAGPFRASRFMTTSISHSCYFTNSQLRYIPYLCY